MLYLHPPFYEFEGVQVFSDFHDSLQFYYGPAAPHLATDDQGRPAIRFIAFKQNLDELEEGEEAAVGVLVFDSSLAWPEQTLDRVRQKLRQELALDGEPRLVPLPYRDGTVQLTFLDRQTELPPDEDNENNGDNTQPSEAEAEHKWLPFLESSGIPSFYGENRAIFSAMLNKKATQLLFGAFEGFMPAGVVYNLSYVGMQRAFRVNVQADWETIYHHLNESWNVDLVFVSVNTSDILDELEENQLITITSEVNAIDDPSIVEEERAVRDELQKFILDTFFEPITNPEQQDTDSPIAEGLSTARSVINMVHHWPTVGYRRVELDITRLKALNIDFTVNQAVERRIAPQAHLSMFFEDFNITREDVITVVEGEDAFWQTVEFDLSVNADFQGHGIHSIVMDVQYGAAAEDGDPEEHFDEFWSFRFNAELDREKRRAWYDPAVGHHFMYRYTINFKPDALPSPSHVLTSGWREHASHLLVVSPAELYQARTIDIVFGPHFPFDFFPQTFVKTRYVDQESGWTLEESAILSQEKPSFSYSFRVPAGATRTIDYQITYLGADGKNIAPPPHAWLATTDDTIIVHNPMHEFFINLIIGGDRSKIADLIIDLKYEDPANEIIESNTLFINQSNINERHSWKVPRKNPHLNRFQYNQLLVTTDGNVTSTGWQQSESPTLVVGEVFAMMMEVHPEFIGPSLSHHDVERVRLRLMYEDEANDHRLEKEMLFSGPGKGETWQLRLKDANVRTYHYEIEYIMENGFDRKIGPIASRDNFLLLSTVPPEAS
jgi:hypothetical protein